MRQFESGATRNSDEGKFDYEGFLSPFVLEEFGRYMHKHRFLETGEMRASDNWMKGIPEDQYMKSLLRHVFEIWRLHRTGTLQSPEGKEALMATMFNTQGLTYEILKRERTPKVYESGND